MNELSIFDSLFNDAFDNGLADYGFARKMAVPKVDVAQTNDAYTLEMDLPGRSEKDVNLELDQNVLTISSIHEVTKETSSEKSGEQNSAENAEATNEGKAKSDSKKWLIKERKTSSFSRRFTLPDDIDAENVSATFKNGVLNVKIPRKALAAPRTIAITA